MAESHGDPYELLEPMWSGVERNKEDSSVLDALLIHDSRDLTVLERKINDLISSFLEQFWSICDIPPKKRRASTDKSLLKLWGSGVFNIDRDPHEVAGYLPAAYVPDKYKWFWRVFTTLVERINEVESWKACNSLLDTHIYPILESLFELHILSNSAEREFRGLDLVCTRRTKCIGFNGIKTRFWPILLRILDSNELDESEEECILLQVVELLSHMRPSVAQESSGLPPRSLEEFVLPLLERRIFYRCKTVCLGVSEIARMFAYVDPKCAQKMVPHFVEFAQDDDEMRRQESAEIITMVACTVPLNLRKSVFVPLYCKLLRDPHQAVSCTAYYGLGLFIVALSNLDILKIVCYNTLTLDGAAVWSKNLKFMSFSVGYGDSIGHINSNLFRKYFTPKNPVDFSDDAGLALEYNLRVRSNEKGGHVTNGSVSCNSEMCEEYTEFNNFLFWRDPLPNVDAELELTNGDRCAEEEGNSETCRTKSNHKFNVNTEISVEVRNDLHSSAPSKERIPEDQTPICPVDTTDEINGIPKILIDKFLNDKYDYDSASRAYSFPAVLLCLGRENWPLLKEVYDSFFVNSHSIEAQIASSYLHELAEMLGSEVAERDLVPLFIKLFQDGAYKSVVSYIEDFCKALSSSGRLAVIPKILECAPMKNLISLFMEDAGSLTIPYFCQYIWPAALSLLKDRNRLQRNEAIKLGIEVLSHVAIDLSHFQTILAELAEQLAHSSQWYRRQTFIMLCSEMICESIVSDELFSRDLLPHLLDLSWDRVPNVRISVAKTLTYHILPQPYFANVDCVHREVVLNVLKRLQTDKDRDVRYFASLLKQLSPSHVRVAVGH